MRVSRLAGPVAVFCAVGALVAALVFVCNDNKPQPEPQQGVGSPAETSEAAYERDLIRVQDVEWLLATAHAYLVAREELAGNNSPTKPNFVPMAKRVPLWGTRPEYLAVAEDPKAAKERFAKERDELVAKLRSAISASIQKNGPLPKDRQRDKIEERQAHIRDGLKAAHKRLIDADTVLQNANAGNRDAAIMEMHTALEHYIFELRSYGIVSMEVDMAAMLFAIGSGDDATSTPALTILAGTRGDGK